MSRVVEEVMLMRDVTVRFEFKSHRLRSARYLREKMRDLQLLTYYDFNFFCIFLPDYSNICDTMFS